MFSFCKIGGLARAFCQAGCLASANLGGLVPRRAVFSAGSRGLVPFRGEISSLVPAVGRISRFGTRRRANLKVWYPQKPLRQIATRHFSGCEEPNRRSWQKSGYQTSRFAIIRGLNRTGGTKSPVLGRGVPNAQSWHDGHQIPAPEEGRLIAIFKITRFYKQKNETFRYKIAKICWRRRCVTALRERRWRCRLWRRQRP